MTKYLIIVLIGLILITIFVLLFNSSSTTQQLQPSSSPTSSPLKSSLPLPNPSIPLATPLPSEDIAEYQSQTDRLYADQQKKQDEEYPWLQQLPLQNSDYFVYFETSNNTFTAEIYNASQEQQLKQEILNRLSRLNINTSEYNIIWQVK